MTRITWYPAVLLGCCLLVACSASPPMRYYTLRAIAPAAPISSVANAPVVRVEPVVIPPELDRLELVSRSGPYSVHIADTDRWAAPLEDQVRRIVSDDLSSRLPAHLVADPNEPVTNASTSRMSATRPSPRMVAAAIPATVP